MVWLREEGRKQKVPSAVLLIHKEVGKQKTTTTAETLAASTMHIFQISLTSR